LTASITGAGLIIAIYALITPLMRKIFEERVKLHKRTMKAFDKLKEKISSESSDKDFKQLKTLAAEIKEMRMFPRYLGFGVSLVFTSYMMSAMFATMWLVFETYRNFVYEFMVANLFFFSTIVFFLIGIYAIVDVHRAMRGEFEQVKKEKEEVKRVSEAFEETFVVRGLVKKKREKDEKKDEA